MRIIDAEQGTEEWLMARLGCPSGSGFSKLITAQGKESTSRNGYVNGLIAEKVMNEIPETYENEWMIRGRTLEPDARAFYEFERRVSVQEVGFCKHDEYECGISPDGLVNTDGGLEIKCPLPHTQIGWLLAGELPNEYKPQVHGSLIITGRQWWDFVAYCPGLPELVVRVEPDEYTEKLREALEGFHQRYQEIESQVISLGREVLV